MSDFKVNKRILIGFEQFSAYLGIGIHRILRHKAAMKAAGIVEGHFYQGRLYSVALPGELNRYWKERRFD
jgi:hypothetical protein